MPGTWPCRSINAATAERTAWRRAVAVGAPDHRGVAAPPGAAKGVPGLGITLMTGEAGSGAPGTQIIYKGLSAGKIETRVFHPETGKVEFGAFISREYAPLVRNNTKFWNTSGINVEIGANGFALHAGTPESLLVGGITFAQPDNAPTASAGRHGARVVLFDGLPETQTRP